MKPVQSEFQYLMSNDLKYLCIFGIILINNKIEFHVISYFNKRLFLITLHIFKLLILK